MFNKLAIAKIANYLILIQFFRIYNKKNIVKKFKISKLISFAIVEIKVSKNANKKKIEINKTIKITIIIKTITLAIKNSIENVENFKKKIEIAIAKIAIKIKIVATIIVNNNNLYLQKYAKTTNIIIKTQYATTITK